jgi:hypothetical protein
LELLLLEVVVEKKNGIKKGGRGKVKEQGEKKIVVGVL